MQVYIFDAIAGGQICTVAVKAKSADEGRRILLRDEGYDEVGQQHRVNVFSFVREALERDTKSSRILYSRFIS